MAPFSRRIVLAAIAGLAALALLMVGPIAQWPDYHAFADDRAAFGIANAANVLSNVPFALVGIWGWLRSRDRSTTDAGAAVAWQAFAVSLVLTAFGSTAYHLAPSNGPLVFDRLPIAFACAAITCAFLAERVDRRWATPAAVATALAVAAASVAWWWFTEQQAGRGDLRPYLYVQFLPMLLVVAGLVLRLRAPAEGARSDRAWWTVLALYAFAKAAELADAELLRATGVISGHTLKHLLAAAGASALFAVVRTGSRR